MKRIVKYILPLMLLMLVSPPIVRAQGDAAVLAPLLEKWELLQLGKFSEQTRSMIDQLNTTLEGLETAKNTYGEINKVYRAASAVFSGVDQIYNVYTEADNLYKSSIYAYEHVKRNLTSGNISLEDASYILSRIEYLDRAGQRTLKDLLNLIEDENLNVEFKLKKMGDNLNYIRGLSRIVSNDLNELNNEIESNKEYETMSRLAMSAYSSPPKGELANPIGWRTTSQAEKDYKSATSSVSKKSTNKADLDEKEVKQVSKNINKLGETVLNIITGIIGLLFVIMAVPAYIRRNQGHQQSSDAIIKLFRGTLIIIIVIQVLGRIFFAIR